MNYLRMLGWLLAGGMLCGGCQGSGVTEGGAPQASPTEARHSAGAAAASAPATGPASASFGATSRPGQGAIMATVNGQPIYMSEFYDLLVRGQGLVLGQQLIVGEMVRQEAQRQSITVTEAEFQAENDRMMRDVFGMVEDSEARERLLMQLFAEKGLTRQSWDLAVQRNALLRKLASPRVKIAEDDLRQEFVQQFGRKVVVSHIEVESLKEAESLLQQLRDKADFAELAKKHSRNPSSVQGGKLSPIGPGSLDMPAAIRQVALSMKEVGEVSSPVKVGYAFHILKLEKIIEPQDVKFEAVRDKLQEVVAAKALRAMQQQVVMELMQKGRYEFVDPALREMNAEAMRKN